jgi:hypothetical protein
VQPEREASIYVCECTLLRFGATTTPSILSTYLYNRHRSRMRSSINTLTNPASHHIQANTTVPSTASPKITMTIHTKPQRHTRKYRPIERPDGVITEHPRYQPVGSSSNADLKFEKKLFSLEEIPRPSKQDLQSKFAVRESDLIGIGAALEDTGRDGYNGLADGERVGNQELSSKLDAESLPRDFFAGMTPMDRFLYEAGAWASCSQ